MQVHRALISSAVVAVLSFGCEDSPSEGMSAVSTQPDAGVTSDASAAADASSSMTDAGDTSSKASDAAMADVAQSNTSGEVDYAKPENWLCRPEHEGACDTNLDATVVQADGTLSVEKFEPAKDPPIDCFYVYPTVSLDETPNSDLVPGPEEESVVHAQFARFASQCRLFAPMYRQVTLTALRASIAGMSVSADRSVGYRDVLAAFRYYLEHDNQGRGIVLVGHSQGSGVLTQLLQNELDKEDLDSRFIAALLLGTNVTVPKDEDVGGTFKHIPLCRSADQLGCVIVYASFRADTPPSDTTNFARSTDPNVVAGCTNPAALGGGSGELHAYLSTDGPGVSSNPMPDWVEGGDKLTTPFVSVPGLLSAECLFAHTGYYLAITVHGDPSDPRVDDIVGDVVTNGEVQADWGLHLIDAHLAMGNLLDIVHEKAAAYAKR